jgi:hypothetical protein
MLSPSVMCSEVASASTAYQCFAAHLSAVITVYVLPVLAVVGLLLTWWFRKHPPPVPPSKP